MPYINPSIVDMPLAYIVANGSRLDICTAEPASYAQATTTFSLANAEVTLSGPLPGDEDGRKINIPAVTDGTVTGIGMGAYYAISNGSNELLLAGPLENEQAFDASTGLPLTTSAFSVALRAPAVEI